MLVEDLSQGLAPIWGQYQKQIHILQEQLKNNSDGRVREMVPVNVFSVLFMPSKPLLHLFFLLCERLWFLRHCPI